MRNSIAKCAVALLRTRSAFTEQHVATGKHQKGTEKRNILFGHINSYFVKNEIILSSFLGHKKWP